MVALAVLLPAGNTGSRLAVVIAWAMLLALFITTARFPSIIASLFGLGAIGVMALGENLHWQWYNSSQWQIRTDAPWSKFVLFSGRSLTGFDLLLLIGFLTMIVSLGIVLINQGDSARDSA